MKLFALILSGIFFCHHLFGQITLTQADIASPGDIIENIAPPFDGDLPPAGPNQTYNFMVDSVGFADTTYFVNPSTTPYGTMMAGSNLAAVDFGSYTYFEKDASGFYLRGIVVELPPIGVSVPISVIPLRFNPRVGILSFPTSTNMNLRTQSTARFRFAYDTVVTVTIFGQPIQANVDSVEIVATLRDTSSITGYGTAQFPSGNLATLRNRHAQNISFAIRVRAQAGIFPPNWVAFPVPGLPVLYNVSYLFWANGKKGPVATLNVDSLGFVTDAGFQAGLLSLNTGLADLKVKQEFQPFPNPANGWVNLGFAEGERKIEIFSADGKKIKEKSLASGESNLATTDLPSGLFWMEIQENGFQKIRKKLIVR